MFLFSNPIICVLIIGVIMSIPTFALMWKVDKLQQIVNDYSLELLSYRKKVNTLYDATKEMYNQESENSESLTSLTSGVQYLIKDYQAAKDDKIYPTPQLSEMIGVTIREQISTEEMLSHNMRIPNPTSSTKIIENVCKTYPHVDQEYITKRVFATIESDIQKARAGE